ncbi:hypothetical protein FOZ60_004203 [Perkinsus olseni]|uniref:Uncharacterized protein n=1 Tax=Perkinsus olseni TaxID=32597 RepID=A0A7J6NTX3_PEROL|nr:hypothetical protein FOZ60_004203 [Perkinsus olseni]
MIKGVPRCYVCALEGVVESYVESLHDDKGSQDSPSSSSSSSPLAAPRCISRAKASTSCDRCCARNTPELLCYRFARVGVKYFPQGLSCHICGDAVESYEGEEGGGGGGTVCLKCFESKAGYVPQLVIEKPLAKPFLCLHCLELTFMCCCDEAKAIQNRLILEQPLNLDAPFYFMMNSHALAPQPIEHFYVHSLQAPRPQLVALARDSAGAPQRVITALKLLDVVAHRSTVRRWTVKEHQTLRRVLSKLQEPAYRREKLKSMPADVSRTKSEAIWLLKESEKWCLPVPSWTALMYLYECSVHEEYLLSQAARKVHTRVCRILHKDSVDRWSVNELLDKIWPSMEKKVFFRSSQTHRVKRSGDEHIYKHSGAMRRQMDRFCRGLVRRLVRNAAWNILSYRRWHYIRTIAEEARDGRGDRVYRCTICGPFPEYPSLSELEAHLFDTNTDAAHKERWKRFEKEMIKAGKPPDSSTIAQWNARFNHARPGCKIPVTSNSRRYTWATPPYQATLRPVSVWDPPCDTAPRREGAIQRTAKANEDTPWLALAPSVTREKGRQDVCNAWDLRKDRESENETFLGPSRFTSQVTPSVT